MPLFRSPWVVAATILLSAAAMLIGCDRSAPIPPPPAAQPAPAPVAEDQLTQVSIINALMLGQYDGLLPLRDLLRYGDFGLGTCDHLDGELIVLGGKAYQARADGTVRTLSLDDKTPFAVITSFQEDGRFSCPAAKSLEELDTRLNKQLPGPNTFVAIRIDGKFDSLHFRSVPRQEPPYLPLADVAKKQTTWTRQDVEGTLVGLRSPAWTAGLNVPGFHWHFISNDRQIGGHVMDCVVKSGEVTFDACDSWLIKLSGSAEFNSADLGRNLSKELEGVERARGK